MAVILFGQVENSLHLRSLVDDDGTFSTLDQARAYLLNTRLASDFNGIAFDASDTQRGAQNAAMPDLAFITVGVPTPGARTFLDQGEGIGVSSGPRNREKEIAAGEALSISIDDAGQIGTAFAATLQVDVAGDVQIQFIDDDGNSVFETISVETGTQDIFADLATGFRDVRLSALGDTAFNLRRGAIDTEPADSAGGTSGILSLDLDDSDTTVSLFFDDGDPSNDVAIVMDNDAGDIISMSGKTDFGGSPLSARVGANEFVVSDLGLGTTFTGETGDGAVLVNGLVEVLFELDGTLAGERFETFQFGPPGDDNKGADLDSGETVFIRVFDGAGTVGELEFTAPTDDIGALPADALATLNAMVAGTGFTSFSIIGDGEDDTAFTIRDITLAVTDIT